MMEEKLLEQIKASAQDIDIPEELHPDVIQKQLKSKKHKSLHFVVRFGSAAAGVALLCSMGIVYYSAQIRDNAHPEESMEMAEAAVAESAEIAENAEEESVTEFAAKKDAGDLYHVAADYEEVYSMLEDTFWEEDEMEYSMTTKGEMAFEDAVEELAKESVAEEEVSYSKTNVQTLGVDESDIVKTDGKYLYIVDSDVLRIVDIQTDKMEVISEIQVSNGDNSSILEMFVDNERIYLIIQSENTNLLRDEIEIYPPSLKYGDNSDVTKAKESMVENLEEVYVVNTTTQTKLLTYDITDRSNPKCCGEIAQDGYYKTSRKIGDIVYLFTEEYLGGTTEQTLTRDGRDGVIPLINGEAVTADCIYLPKTGQQGLVVSSVNVSNPSEIVDAIMVVNDYVSVYVSQNALYLYNGTYSKGQQRTEMASFSLKENGEINAVGAATVDGEVNDTFAVSEQNGKLRMITTDWSGEETTNQLYIFDENLKITGTLKNLAKGEEVYAARFLGDMAYVVTYRNTDPLFVIDLSDEMQPKVVSELKITGFSDYLHFWGEDKLVGIGLETDENTGENLGLKIAMFDISDAANVTAEKTLVLKNVDTSPALNQYKTVLIDEEENLLGFAVSSYNVDTADAYLLFSYEEDGFRELLSQSLGEDVITAECRGLYVGERFYLVQKDCVFVYDRTEYQQIEKLEF